LVSVAPLRSKELQNLVLLAGGLRRALSPTFRAGAMVFFIPWRVVAEVSVVRDFETGGILI
jgi:hypothetical protein